jgi:hypothetical protein
MYDEFESFAGANVIQSRSINRRVYRESNVTWCDKDCTQITNTHVSDYLATLCQLRISLSVV